MNKVVSIGTKLRPTKKLLLIDQDQRSILASFVNFVSEEISGFRNIVLLNDGVLLSKERVEFVNRHDPDVILNYSKCSDDVLRDTFRTRVHNGEDRQQPKPGPQGVV